MRLRIAHGLMLGALTLAAETAHASVCVETAVSVSESFDDDDFENEDVSSVDGWGDGAITLSAKGNSFETSAESFGVRVFVGASGDFDGDGYNDMVAQLLSPDCHLHFLRNRGRDTSVVPPVFLGFDTGNDAGSPGFDAYRLDTPPVCSGSGPGLLSGDFDGDDDTDFIYFTIRNQNQEGRVDHAYYYENLGTVGGLPNFATRVDIVSQFLAGTYEPAWHWTSNPFQVVDWDRDGRDDIVLGSSYGASSRVLLFRSNGSGFEPGYALLTDSGLTAPFADYGANATSGCSGNSRGINGIAVADFDGDADYDLVIGSLSQAELMYWRNDGSNVFTRMPNIAFPEAGVTFSLAADFDGDGDNDLMVGRDGWNCGGQGGRVYFFSNDGTGTFTRRAEPVVDAGADLDYGLAFNIDADSNGYADLIAADGNNSGTYSQMISSNLEIYNLEGVGQSLVLDTLSNDTNAITKVLVDVSDSIPDGTGYTLYVSSNGGEDWEEIGEDKRYGQEEHTFTHFGSDFVWRVEMNAEEDTLDSDELAFAPAARSTPVIFEIDFTYTYVDRRLYSRSGLALATDLEVPLVGTTDVLYGSAFYYPGYEGFLYAYNISDFEGQAGGSILESVTDDAAVTVLWEAGEGLRSQNGGSRVLYTARDTDGDGAMDDRTLFVEANASALAPDMAMSAAEAEDLIAYVHGGMEHPDGWKLYDAGHSTPVYVGPPQEDADYGMYADHDYAAFQLANETRSPRVYVGSNAGMVHAFDAITGAEEWAFIPNNLLARLKQQRQADENGVEKYNHQFLVDGQLTVRDVYDVVANEWRTVLISGQALGQGRGDNNYYFALDVTDPSDPLPLWEFTDEWNSARQSCSGVATISECTTTCASETCSDSCADPNHIFEEASTGAIYIEAESFNGSSTIDNTHMWVDVGAGACPPGTGGRGFSGSCVNTSPTSPDVNCGLDEANCGAQLIYDFQTQTAGTYRVYVRGLGPSGSDNSVLVKVDEGEATRVNLSSDGTWSWETDSTTYNLAAGDHTVTVYMRENGTFVDKLLVTTGSAPSDSDYGASQQCMEQCTPGSCTETCTETTLTENDEWPECGTGNNMRCCAGEPLQVCAPIGEACPTVENAMGETWSRPAIGRVTIDGDKRFITAFGSGYDNIETPTDAVGRSVYMIDVVSGVLLDRWDFNDLVVGGSNPSTIENAVPATPELVDLDDDGDVDRMYIGDLEGRLWKVDLEDDGETIDGMVSDLSWPACVVFDAGDPERDGTRTWAPIITKVAAAFPDASGFPHLYFGTGGDDRVPSDLRYRFYAIRDDVDCLEGGDPYVALIDYDDLSLDELEWVVGDGVGTDFNTDLEREDAEGDANDRYWSDPVVLDNTFVFFASLPGSIESVNPCDNLDGGSKFYAYAARSFFDDSASVQRIAGTSIFGDNPFLNAGSKIRQAVVLRKDGSNETVTRRKETPVEVDPTDVFVQEFASGDAEQPDVLAITTPRVGENVTEIRVTRWREIALRR